MGDGALVNGEFDEFLVRDVGGHVEGPEVDANGPNARPEEDHSEALAEQNRGDFVGEGVLRALGLLVVVVEYPYFAVLACADHVVALVVVGEGQVFGLLEGVLQIAFCVFVVGGPAVEQSVGAGADQLGVHVAPGDFPNRPGVSSSVHVQDVERVGVVDVDHLLVGRRDHVPQLRVLDRRARFATVLVNQLQAVLQHVIKLYPI